MPLYESGTSNPSGWRGCQKPQKAHWLEMLRTYGLSTKAVIHIAGSIYHDIIPASEMGLKTIWVNRYKEPLPTNVDPTYTVDDLREILEIL
ncbi:MAG: HAD family hydrolase [Candidatus Thermoplasmatota archaeon]|nr:HAD family hydrolase [Candidatus Thermoplasmatota archaeon]